MWAWVKMNPPGDRRFQPLVPFIRVPFWVRIFDNHSHLTLSTASKHIQPRECGLQHSTTSAIISQRLETICHFDPNWMTNFWWLHVSVLTFDNLKDQHVGMGQNEPTRGPKVLAFGSIYQGKPVWVRIFDHHSHVVLQLSALNSQVWPGCALRARIASSLLHGCTRL